MLVSGRRGPRPRPRRKKLPRNKCDGCSSLVNDDLANFQVGKLFLYGGMAWRLLFLFIFFLLLKRTFPNSRNANVTV